MGTIMYSPEQVAERLGLHVRTVRNYVREGRLKAVRIGKQYRIAREDLAAMTGRPVESFDPEPARRDRHIEVSSIVEIDAISPDLTMRLTNALTAAPKSRPAADQPLRIESIYNQERGRLKIILTGGVAAVASLLQFIAFFLETKS